VRESRKPMDSEPKPMPSDKPPSVPLQPVVRFLDGFIWLRIDALDNAVLRWRRLGKYRRWWEPRHAPLRLLHAALVYARMPFYRRAKTDWQIHESNPEFHAPSKAR